MTVPVDEWLHALQLRMKLVAPHLRRRPGEFPVGWEEWVAEPTRANAPAVPPADIATAVAARGTAPPPKCAPELGRWASFKSLSRGQWGPPPEDERGMRRAAWVIAVGWHVLVAAMLVWLMYQHYLAPANPPRQGQEDVVQVEFVGQGSPEEVGGGPEQAPAPSAQNAAADAAASAQQPEVVARQPPSTQPQAVETPATVIAVPQPTTAAPEETAQPSPPEVSQAVQVSEPVPDTDTDYVLPPPMPRLQIPQLTVPDQNLPAPEVAVIELPGRQAPALSAIAPRPVPEISVEHSVPDVLVREIAAPLPALPTTKVAQPTIAVSQQPLKAQPLRERSIPSSSANAVATRPAESSAAEAVPSRSEAPASASKAASSTSSPVTGSSQNAGPKPTAAPGGWSSPKRADDWGDSTRDVAGGQRGDPSGLYNSDGSLRLAQTPGSAAPARPPGTVTDEIVNLDRGGTWLKRKPTDYEPTTFDRYWRPNESLLEEWVRKSITTVRIPIPGTNKHVVCTTVMLVMGGGCGITDPNLLDVPPTARPAPDIPFKPGLQENNGSLPDPVE